MVVQQKRRFTTKQGQYLAFIYYYTEIHGRPPSEAEMQNYFSVSPPSVHQMVLSLQARGLITREPGAPRSIRLLLPRSELPDLEARSNLATKLPTRPPEPATCPPPCGVDRNIKTFPRDRTSRGSEPPRLA